MVQTDVADEEVAVVGSSGLAEEMTRLAIGDAHLAWNGRLSEPSSLFAVLPGQRRSLFTGRIETYLSNEDRSAHEGLVGELVLGPRGVVCRRKLDNTAK